MLLFMWSYILLTPFGELLYLRGALLSFIYVLLSQSSSVYRGGVRRTEESVYCLRCLNYCHCRRYRSLRLSPFRFDNAVLSQPAGRDFATLPATNCCRRYRSLRLSPFGYTMNSLISQFPKRVTSLWVTPLISASIIRQKKP